MPIGWQCRPGYGELRGDGRGLALLHEGDELGESPRLMLVLVSKPLAHAQILLECGSQSGHRTPPGHGRLNVRSSLDIHLRVDARGVMALVSQQLADLRQGRAGSEKLGGKAVSEDMGPVVGVATDTGALQGGLGDHRNRATGCKADVRRQRAQKQPATRRRRAAITQVGNDSRADVWRHRHSRSLPTLGANEHLAGSPVDIIQGEGRDLASP